MPEKCYRSTLINYGRILMTKAYNTAKILLETQAVQFSLDTPFVLSNGLLSPVHIDCRKLIGFVAERRQIIQMWQEMLLEKFPDLPFDCIAGGENAGIPYGALLAEALDKPMAYVRKSPKSVEWDARIEGNLQAGERVLLVEDLLRNDGVELRFVEAIRAAKAEVSHCVVVFEDVTGTQEASTLTDAQLSVHALANWQDILDYATEHGSLTSEQISEIQSFLAAPELWAPKSRLKLENFDTP